MNASKGVLLLIIGLAALAAGSLATFLGHAALESLSSKALLMEPGAIVVKENYKPDSTLVAVACGSPFKPGDPQ